jgi:PAS domain S-box-containing protein
METSVTNISESIFIPPGDGLLKRARVKVLLVEDSEADTHLVLHALTRTSETDRRHLVFDTRCANCLSDAERYLANDDFDVALLDLSLPDGGGLETLVRLRAYAPEVPIIVMTGLDDEELGLETVRAGAQDYLVKGQADARLLRRAIEYAIERKRTEQALRDSEEKFRSIVETTSEWIWSMDRSRRLTYSNPAVEVILGYGAEEIVGQQATVLIHEADRQKIEIKLPDLIRQKRGWTAMVLRWRHKNGTYRYLSSNAAPILDRDGEIIGYRGTSRDITERQQAKISRMELQLRLVTVQEEERHRLSRELHDQMGQSVAALLLGLKSLKDSGSCQDSAKDRLKQLQELTNQLGQQVHEIAMDLRPTALNDLGLHTAVSNYLDDWSRRSKIRADFHSNELVRKRLPTHVETTFYRFVQEALTNILKHAKATNVSVILTNRNNGVQAIVEDDGRGFDVEAMMSLPVGERRLGLLGMAERVSLVGGRFSVESTPSVGTTLFVSIDTDRQEVPQS